MGKFPKRIPIHRWIFPLPIGKTPIKINVLSIFQIIGYYVVLLIISTVVLALFPSLIFPIIFGQNNPNTPLSNEEMMKYIYLAGWVLGFIVSTYLASDELPKITWIFGQVYVENDYNQDPGKLCYRKTRWHKWTCISLIELEQFVDSNSEENWEYVALRLYLLEMARLYPQSHALAWYPSDMEVTVLNSKGLSGHKQGEQVLLKALGKSKGVLQYIGPDCPNHSYIVRYIPPEIREPKDPLDGLIFSMPDFLSQLFLQESRRKDGYNSEERLSDQFELVERLTKK